jgi:hypothetical protein
MSGGGANRAAPVSLRAAAAVFVIADTKQGIFLLIAANGLPDVDLHQSVRLAVRNVWPVPRLPNTSWRTTLIATL